ncbi:MAG: HlyD family efflux transporter periplasmic adaptor subunit [Oxalobacteraceae bacterium]|jgi:HlyD family secretion protein|nr:HlyD family efflux transporter periplasmic adaptor subunit [Oxalobacteraceae bacterium]
MRKKITLIIVILSALFLLIWAFTPTAIQVETVTIERGYFERCVEDDGWTRVRDRYVIYAPVTGHLLRTKLREGDAVKRGNTVATIFPLKPPFLDERAVLERRERVRSLEANARAAEVNVERAQLALRQAEIDLQRNEHLFERHFISASAVETFRLTKQLRQKELANSEKIAQSASHSLAEARIGLLTTPERSQIALRPSLVTSPVTGRVLRIPQPSENIVTMGTPLVEVGNPSQLEVLVELLTEDATEVQPGMIARLSHWGGSRELEARVRLIEPSAFTKISALGVEEQRVNVILDITSPTDDWKNLGDRFRVDIKIPVQTADDALMVPVGALFPMGSRYGLYLAEDKRAKLTRVDVIARNGQQAWIRSDLKPGVQAVAYPPAKLTDGDRISPVPN